MLINEGGEPIGERVVERSWEKSPVACPSWHSPEPGYLHGLPRSDKVLGKHWAYDSPGLLPFIETVKTELGHAGPIAYKVGDVLPKDYLRFIAKVTHSYAVALFGFNAFQHWLTDLILCTDDAVSYLVGGIPDIGPPVPDGAAFRIDFGHPTNELPVLLARVRLFEFLGTPEHLVVVGAARPTELPRLKPLDQHGRPQG